MIGPKSGSMRARDDALVVLRQILRCLDYVRAVHHSNRYIGAAGDDERGVVLAVSYQMDLHGGIVIRE